ncbi:MAG TPA: histidinol dehydrogenase, partial [Treponemataceae bacterium]|nr:histidinol dehydrogenase [Treponemataceae bacterium]
LTTSAALADAVTAELEIQLRDLPGDAPARKSLAGNSAVIIVETLEQAVNIANRKAPEHLELALEAGGERERLVKELRNYGSLFIGHGSAEILGDYAAGLNHTLPTSGAARFTGGLSVRHFLKTVTTLRTGEAGSDRSGWEASLAAAEQLALAEGLTFHARAARCRMD